MFAEKFSCECIKEAAVDVLIFKVAEPAIPVDPIINCPVIVSPAFCTKVDVNCAEPETVPEGNKDITCADPLTTPEGSCAEPDHMPVPDNTCELPETNPAGIFEILKKAICDEPETSAGLSVIPLNEICAEPDTTDIPLKNAPECIVVPASTCDDPDTTPDGS